MPTVPKTRSNHGDSRVNPYAPVSQRMCLSSLRPAVQSSNPTSDVQDSVYQLGQGFDGYPEEKYIDKTLISAVEPGFKAPTSPNRDSTGEGLGWYNPQQCLGEIAPNTEPTPEVRPAFELTLPFDKLPGSIAKGFGLLTALYSTHHPASCIADCIRNLQFTIDLGDPAVELALIMVTVLGSPSPLPKVVNGLDDFQKHAKHGREKSKWRAVLFIKMMWYRYHDLMTTDVKEKFTSYQGQQTITSIFLLKIGWVVSGAQFGSRINKQARHDLKLIPEGTIRRKLEKYKRLIASGDSLRLARKIFDEDSSWAEMAVEGFTSLSGE